MNTNLHLKMKSNLSHMELPSDLSLSNTLPKLTKLAVYKLLKVLNIKVKLELNIRLVVIKNVHMLNIQSMELIFMLINHLFVKLLFIQDTLPI